MSYVHTHMHAGTLWACVCMYLCVCLREPSYLHSIRSALHLLSQSTAGQQLVPAVAWVGRTAINFYCSCLFSTRRQHHLVPEQRLAELWNQLVVAIYKLLEPFDLLMDVWQILQVSFHKNIKSNKNTKKIIPIKNSNAKNDRWQIWKH